MPLTEEVIKMFLDEVRYAYFGKMTLADFLQVNRVGKARLPNLFGSWVWLSRIVISYFLSTDNLLQNFGEEVRGEELHDILREIDTNMNGQVELDEYLQVGLREWPLTD